MNLICLSKLLLPKVGTVKITLLLLLLCMTSFSKYCLLNKYVCGVSFTFIDILYYFGED
jgi:hypothetical protein